MPQRRPRAASAVWPRRGCDSAPVPGGRRHGATYGPRRRRALWSSSRVSYEHSPPRRRSVLCVKRARQPCCGSCCSPPRPSTRRRASRCASKSLLGFAHVHSHFLSALRLTLRVSPASLCRPKSCPACPTSRRCVKGSRTRICHVAAGEALANSRKRGSQLLTRVPPAALPPSAAAGLRGCRHGQHADHQAVQRVRLLNALFPRPDTADPQLP